MCCTLTEELVPGHCLIVPIQHYMSSLEMDDEDWEEVKVSTLSTTLGFVKSSARRAGSKSTKADALVQNFMKCLMRMHAKDNKGVLFYETILSFKQQRHTYIEAVPVPFDQFQDCPAYFRVSRCLFSFSLLLAWLSLSLSNTHPNSAIIIHFSRRRSEYRNTTADFPLRNRS